MSQVMDDLMLKSYPTIDQDTDKDEMTQRRLVEKYESNSEDTPHPDVDG